MAWNKEYTGGKVYGSWRELSEACKKRDKYTCIRCNAKGSKAGGTAILHADHIKAKSKGGRDRLSNLKTLCETCHARKTPHMRKANRKKRAKKNKEWIL